MVATAQCMLVAAFHRHSGVAEPSDLGYHNSLSLPLEACWWSRAWLCARRCLCYAAQVLCAMP